MNDYKVIRQIGEGAFGKAFLVHERQRGGDGQRVVKEIDLQKVRWQLYTNTLVLSATVHILSAVASLFFCGGCMDVLSHDSTFKVQTER